MSDQELDRILEEAHLKNYELLYRHYFELGPIGKGTTRPDKSWIEINDHLCSMFGYPKAELLKKTWAELTYPEDLAKDIALFNSMLAGENNGYAMDKRFLKKDGSLFYANIAVSCIRTEEGKVKHVIATFLDITKHKQDAKRIGILSQALLESQEKERQRISRDLHDNVAQDLSSLKIALETRLKDSKENIQLIRILQTAIDNLREIAYNLRPAGLEELGLVRTMAQYCDDFTRVHGIEVDFESAGLDFAILDEPTAINLYRILQEALANIRKHAEASRVMVRLVASGALIILRISDNGRGFNPNREESLPGRHKMGLSNMRERVRLLNGSLNLESSPVNGTRLLIEIPRKEGEHG